MRQTLQISPIAHLQNLASEQDVVAFDVGYDGLAYFVFAKAPVNYDVDHPHKYHIVAMSEHGIVFEMRIAEESLKVHYIQPLGDDILIVSSRSREREGKWCHNGRIYARNGALKSSILLGDGIESVQTTRNGTIWTSFFDEGVFGCPIGASGLVSWSTSGEKTFEFKPTVGLDYVCDCYALNVTSDNDVWFYYYTEFPLVHLHRQEVKSTWAMPVRGSHAFAVASGWALFQGGYDERDVYQLYSIQAGKPPVLKLETELHDENSERVKVNRIIGRGDSIFLQSDNTLYRVQLRDVVAKI